MSKIYARAITRECLLKYGVNEITEDCKVIFDSGRMLSKEEDFTKNAQGYLTFYVYDLDEKGNRIKVPRKKYYSYKLRTLPLHRAIYAWFYGEVPEGMVVDHIDNKHYTLSDNRLENLQLLSPRDNLLKERDVDVRELNCKMTLPLSYYEDKLNAFVNSYNNTKDQEEKHSLRGQISNYRAKIRYWKSHEAEYVKNEEERIKNEETNAIEAKALKSQKERTKELKLYKKILDEARALYKQDPSPDNSYNWRLAVNNYNEYVKTHPFKTQKQLFVELDGEQLRN